MQPNSERHYQFSITNFIIISYSVRQLIFNYDCALVLIATLYHLTTLYSVINRQRVPTDLVQELYVVYARILQELHPSCIDLAYLVKVLQGSECLRGALRNL